MISPVLSRDSVILSNTLRYGKSHSGSPNITWEVKKISTNTCDVIKNRMDCGYGLAKSLLDPHEKILALTLESRKSIDNAFRDVSIVRENRNKIHSLLKHGRSAFDICRLFDISPSVLMNLISYLSLPAGLEKNLFKQIDYLNPDNYLNTLKVGSRPFDKLQDWLKIHNIGFHSVDSRYNNYNSDLIVFKDKLFVNNFETQWIGFFYYAAYPGLAASVNNRNIICGNGPGAMVFPAVVEDATPSSKYFESYMSVQILSE
jgi:hypothetical protein